MQIQSILLALLAGISVGNAAIVDFFDDDECRIPSEEEPSRNIWDGTCAPLYSGFGSYRITTEGGNGQTLTSWSDSSCDGQKTSVSLAKVTGDCVKATDDVSWDSYGMSSSGRYM